MDYLCKALLVLVAIWASYCHGQRTTPYGIMPGIAPSFPNNAINVCLRQATPRPQNRSYTATNARIISTWCSVYDDVLPCLSRTLPAARRASDMYLKLIYNVTMATRMSESLCQRLPYLYDLQCVEEGMGRVAQCMNWTDSVIEHFYSQFIPSRPLTTDRQEMATIYACIISVTTAMCFQKELTSCSFYQRKLMYDYYIMLSGKCREVAGIPETSTQMTSQSTPVTTTETATSSSIETSTSGSGTSRSTRVTTRKPRTEWSRSNNGCVTTQTQTLLLVLVAMLIRYLVIFV